MCCATTQLALQLHRKRTQVVCGNKQSGNARPNRTVLPQWTSEPIMFVGIAEDRRTRFEVGGCFGFWIIMPPQS